MWLIIKYKEIREFQLIRIRSGEQELSCVCPTRRERRDGGEGERERRRERGGDWREKRLSAAISS